MVGVRWCFAGCAVLGMLATLAGCSGGFFFAQREPWRHEAEVECLSSGAVPEGTGIVRLSPITGPGMCGADFPLKVTALGEGAALGFADDPRPPADVPSGAPSWPIVRSPHAPAPQSTPPPYSRPDPNSHAGGAPRREASPAERPISLHPPGVVQPTATAASQTYDYRHPYRAPSERAPEDYRAPRSLSSPREELSPVPYERRRPVEGEGMPHSAVTRAPLREIGPEDSPRPSGRGEATGAPAYEGAYEPSREPSYEPLRRPEVPPLVPLGPARGAEAAGASPPVAVNPPATLACPIVSELERWIAGAVQPAALRWFGSPVTEIKQISAYSCRGMNGVPGAPISEHAFGNALDIAAFTLADGRTITVKNGWHGMPEEQGFLRDVEGAACDQFTTVLAPGSNAYHYDHIHVDLMRHASGYRVCNPRAVSGEEIAARAGWKLAARRPGDPAATGSLAARRVPHPRNPVRANDRDDRYPKRALPIAPPDEDGDD